MRKLFLVILLGLSATSASAQRQNLSIKEALELNIRCNIGLDLDIMIGGNFDDLNQRSYTIDSLFGDGSDGAMTMSCELLLDQGLYACTSSDIRYRINERV